MNNATQNQYDPRLEELAKSEAQRQQGYSNSTLSGCAGLTPTAPGLRERVAQNIDRARSEARRTEALYELQHLLDKNPDVARILELLEVAGVLGI